MATCLHMKTKTILITGANSGIGYQTALGLAKAKHQIVMVCRNKKRGETAQQNIIAETGNNQVDLLLIDLSSQQSIHDGVAILTKRYTQLDVLINNAAIFDITQKQAQMSDDGIETIFATNHLGSFLLTNLLLPLLKASPSARIINIASKGLLAKPFMDIQFDNLNGEKKFNVTDAYYHSKIAQIMFTFDLAERLAGSNIATAIIRVPAVKLDEGRYNHIPAFLRAIYKFKMSFSLSTKEMAALYIDVATSPVFAHVSAVYLNENGEEVQAPKQAYNRNTWKQLWDVSARMVNLKN